MATKQRSSAKADFIRSFPVTASASEVVEKAKAAGLSVSPAHVYGVRKSMDAGRTRGKRAARGRAATVAPPSRPSPVSASNDGARTLSKKAFVLSYSADTPAQDVVRAAAAQGIDLSLGYLYWVRSEAGRLERRVGAGPQRPPRAPSPTPSIRNVGSAAEAERVIVDTALRVVGIERAIAVLEAARGRLGRLLED